MYIHSGVFFVEPIDDMLDKNDESKAGDKEGHEDTPGDNGKKEAAQEDTGEHKETKKLEERVEEAVIQQAESTGGITESTEGEEGVSGKNRDLDTGTVSRSTKKCLYYTRYHTAPLSCVVFFLA